MSEETKLIEMLAGVIQANTAAMEKVAVAVQADADASFKMAVEVKGLRKTVGLAQQKVGVEMGAVIEKQKLTLGKLQAEREEVADARSQTTERRGADAGP